MQPLLLSASEFAIPDFAWQAGDDDQVTQLYGLIEQLSTIEKVLIMLYLMLLSCNSISGNSTN